MKPACNFCSITVQRLLRPVSFLAAFFLLQPAPSAAQSSDANELQQLLDLLQQQTSLATNTHLNVDHVPGMISVIKGEEMLQRGLLTVWDALAYIPGVQRNLDASGERNVIVRGVGKGNESGKIKLLFNGIAVNASASSSAGTLFNTPTAQIDRIEFIRGPGSAIHGEFALMGVLNVITHSDLTTTAITADSNAAWQFDAMTPFAAADMPLQGHLSLSLQESSGETLNAEEDRSQPASSGYAPGQVNNKQDFVSAILLLQLSDIDFSVQFQQQNRGDHFGINQYLPPPPRQTVISTSLLALHLAGKFHLAEDLTANWSLDRVTNQAEKNRLFLGTADQYGGLVGDPDIIADARLDETRYEAALNIRYERGIHQLFAGLSWADTRVGESSQSINLDPQNLLPSTLLNAFPPPVAAGRQRQSVSLALQDEVRVNDNHSLTAGLRYDDYNNIDNRVSPRIAWVWRMSAQHVLKFQHAQAFRPPTLLELDGALSGSLAAETSRTSEISHIFDSDELLLRSTIHYSTLKELISFQDSAPFGYANLAQARLSGVEIEMINRFSSHWRLHSNLDLLDARDKTSDQRLYGSSPWSLSLALDYEWSPQSQVNIQFLALSPRARQPGDSRDELAAQNNLDITISRKKIAGMDGLTARFGIHNLLGEDLRFAAPINSYADDYIFSNDSSLWMRLDYTPGAR